MNCGLLPVACTIVLCITLALGLWPFHSPRNDVVWMDKTDGIVIGKYGVVLGDTPIHTRTGADSGGTVEIQAMPDQWKSSATLLSLYRRSPLTVFTIRQLLDSVEVQGENHEGSDAMKYRLYAGSGLARSLRNKELVLITITSGSSGARLYINGVLVNKAPGLRIPLLSGLRMILGDSPLQPDGFRGRIRGVAIYGTELDSQRVISHYQAWAQGGSPHSLGTDTPFILYLFDEHSGGVVHNRAACTFDLRIPKKYFVVDKMILEPFWTEFDLTGAYWRGNFKNVIGFIPAGFCFCALFLVARPMRHAVPLTVALGFLTSLTIEICQGFLPMRDSGTTDVITNTLGTYLGVLCYTRVYPVVVEKALQTRALRLPGRTLLNRGLYRTRRS